MAATVVLRSLSVCLGLEHFLGGRGLFSFNTNVRKPIRLLQEVEIGGVVNLSPDWGW